MSDIFFRGVDVKVSFLGLPLAADVEADGALGWVGFHVGTVVAGLTH